MPRTQSSTDFEVSELAASEFRELNDGLPSKFDRRDRLILDATIALVQGNHLVAIDQMEEASAMLPAATLPPLADHVLVWYLLATSLRTSGEFEQAAQWYRRIDENPALRLFYPFRYIRSLYFLGTILESQGEAEKAREYYRRFYDYWKDGDIDRERIKEVESKIF